MLIKRESTPVTRTGSTPSDSEWQHPYYIYFCYTRCWRWLYQNQFKRQTCFLTFDFRKSLYKFSPLVFVCVMSSCQFWCHVTLKLDIISDRFNDALITIFISAVWFYSGLGSNFQRKIPVINTGFIQIFLFISLLI